ncbi:unnamed protein product, partial [Polarella glacialis]
VLGAGGQFAGPRPVTNLPCASPVKRAPVKFPRDLIFEDPGVAMYSGYVNVTPDDYLFYWMVEAQEGAPKDSPIIVWSNGGPGCSAMEGATTEIGPLLMFGVKGNSDAFSGKLSVNPFAWNREAHLLFVDQPRYVGFSCGTGPHVESSVEAGKDMVSFLVGWRQTFPEHAHRSFVFASESYGGHFVPAWTSAILDYNSGASEPLEIAGIHIGNGIVNRSIQDTVESFVEFQKMEGLIPLWAHPRTMDEARFLMHQTLKYKPNQYDYRIKSLDCCGCYGYNYAPWSEWLLLDEVTRALNVCGDAGKKAFAGCAGGCITSPSIDRFDRNDKFDYSGALARALELGIPVTLTYGMQDLSCDYHGGYSMASSLEWSGAKAFAAAPLQDLLVEGSLNGKTKTAGGLTWIQVQGSGHMIPANNPAAAYSGISAILRRWRNALPQQKFSVFSAETPLAGASSFMLVTLTSLLVVFVVLCAGAAGARRLSSESWSSSTEHFSHTETRALIS